MSADRPPGSQETLVPWDTTGAPTTPALLLPPRYQDLAFLAAGGMAEVRRVYDTELERAVAMKLIHPHLAGSPGAESRFLAEAKVTGRLDHPGVVPVHELGRTPDGRVFFTMREVRGQTWADLIDALHRASPPDEWGQTSDGWTLQRAVDIWRHVAETLAFAHASEVVHRDLKPANIMVGPWGEALVMDWGLARVGPPPRRVRRGPIAGTPQYMSPEQADGGFAGLDARSDVYSLGLLLRELLTGQPPFWDDAPIPELVARAREGVPALRELNRPVPGELLELCAACTAREPALRPADAGAVVARVRVFQEGARRRERALAYVSTAREQLVVADQLRKQSEDARLRAIALQRPLKPWSDIEIKRKAWTAEDHARALALEVEVAEVQGIEQLRAALAEAPELAEARHALADRYEGQLASAENQRNLADAARWGALLRAVHPERFTAWEQSDGLVTLFTAPSARALLYRCVTEDRRIVDHFEADLGRTPLIDLRLGQGSWVIELSAPNRNLVRYPIFVERNQRTGSAPPGAPFDCPIPLPTGTALGRNDVYVPPGWCVVGGDRQWSASGPRRRVWVDGFIIERHPVTNARYLEFLDALVSEGRTELANACIPRWQGASGEDGVPVVGRGADGRHRLLPDPDGDIWEPDWPVFLIDRFAAEAFAQWEARRTGLPWRLPWELEWEKAARGVDGRTWPWGDTLDLSWACVRGGTPGRVLPAGILAHPLDQSPYGVRGMAGNVQDWCLDAYDPAGPRIANDRPVFRAAGPTEEATVRGGAWNYEGDVGTCGFRTGRRLEHRRESLGFRLARCWPEP